MLLGIDIGNTHIVLILFNKNGEILDKFRIPSKTLLTEDMIYTFLKVLLENRGINLSEIDDIVLSSVVPELDDIFNYFTKKYFNKKPYILTLENIPEKLLKIDNRAERKLGADRIATILAMQNRLKDREAIIIDFGTATTFELVSYNKYLGGAILPGINLSINALFQNTAKLPKITFEKPEVDLANTTVTQINTGIYYSNIGGIKELITHFKKFTPNAYVVATGGQGKIISKDLPGYIDEYIPNLLEEGLYKFYKDICKKYK